MITYKATGGRTVELFVPFDFMGERVESISMAPLTLDHVLRWQKGAWKDSFDLLVELTGQKDELVKSLRYPDADRVLAVFFDMLPPEIQQNIRAGEIPAAAQPAPTQEEMNPEGIGWDFTDQPPVPGTDENG